MLARRRCGHSINWRPKHPAQRKCICQSVSNRGTIRQFWDEWRGRSGHRLLARMGQHGQLSECACWLQRQEADQARGWNWLLYPMDGKRCDCQLSMHQRQSARRRRNLCLVERLELRLLLDGNFGTRCVPSMVVVKSYARKDDARCGAGADGVHSGTSNGWHGLHDGSTYAFIDTCISVDPQRFASNRSSCDAFQHLKYEAPEDGDPRYPRRSDYRAAMTSGTLRVAQDALLIEWQKFDRESSRFPGCDGR